MPTLTKLVWIIAPKPNSLIERWEWPMAMYEGPAMRHAAYLACETPYDEQSAYRSYDVTKIGIVMLKYNHGLPNRNPLEPRRMLCSERFIKMREAIEYTAEFFQRHPEWIPLVH